MVKYSVIVPVYNAEKTLRRCVDSILEQNYPGMELILVNDGSSDGSLDICRAYQDSDVRIRVVDKPNGGVSTARNAGLDVAAGEYVLFVDSDDYVSEKYFETLDRTASEFRYDCVFFSHCVVSETAKKEKTLNPFAAEDLQRCVPAFCEALCRKQLNPPWNKRYVRRIIEENQIRFPEQVYIGEDKLFNLQYVLNCRSCLVSQGVLYFVSTDNQDSLSRKIRPDIYQQLERIRARTRQIIQEADIPEHYREQYHAAENLIQLRAVYSEAKRMHLLGKDGSTRRNVIRQMCDDLNQSGMKLPNNAFAAILKIPVRLKLITLLDIAGKILAKK